MLLVVWFILAIIVPAVFGTLFVVFPMRVIQIQARAYERLYYKGLGMSPEQMEKRPMLPWDRALIGNMRKFIDIAPDHPEEFGDYAVVLRLFGIGLWALGVFFVSRLVS